MSWDEVVARAERAFARDAEHPPPLTLRGGDDVDSYRVPSPYDAALDEPTDAYVERYAMLAMPFLDARSWRHYLPRLVRYAAEHPRDPAMAVEALVRSLRPPDREPTRLTTLSEDQEASVVAFLEQLALGPARGEGDHDDAMLRDDAAQALDEWWLPDARHRRSAPPPPAVDGPVREVGSGCYRLLLPSGAAGGGARRVGSEGTIESWRTPGGPALEVHAGVRPLEEATLAAAVERVEARHDGARRLGIRVPGTPRAWRVDAPTYRYSPAEPRRITCVLADVKGELLTLTVIRDEHPALEAAAERIVASLRVTPV